MAHPSHGHRRGHSLLHGLEDVRVLRRQGRLRVPGTNGIDPEALVRVILGSRAREPDDGVLVGGVGRREPDADDALDGAEVGDRPPLQRPAIDSGADGGREMAALIWFSCGARGGACVQMVYS